MSNKSLFRDRSFKPSKKLGQHFLNNKRILDKMLLAADITKNDTVLEIGPGLGFLTFALAEKAKKVIAVEKSKKMIEILKELISIRKVNNIEIAEGDILNFELRNAILCHCERARVQRGRARQSHKNNYKVVANLPFYITNPVIMKFLEAKNKPKIMVLIIQKEVAQRICAKPPDMNKLAVFCQILSKPKIICYVGKNNFWPKPKIDSAIICLIPISSAKIPKILSRLVNAGFSQPRKQLVNNLAKLFNNNKEKTRQWLLKNNIKPKQRPETLAVENWTQLAKNYRKE